MTLPTEKNPPAAPAIEVRDLAKRYGDRSVVDGVSFTVFTGEVFALLGPNGAGKTTTVEILEGYRRPDAGSARVLGLDPLRQGNGLRERTGLMLQQGGIYPHITVREAVRLFAAFYPRAEDPDNLLRQVGLEHVARSRYRNLSGGEKQRLSLALALVGQPELVFLDEPTTAMDPQARRATWGIIADLRARGATVLLTTHFMDEADFLADRVGIMSHGRLVALDTPAGLRQDLSRGIQLTTDPPIDAVHLARRLGVADAAVLQESDRRVLLRLDPSPELVARVTAALVEEGILVTELHCGSRSLEQAYLALTGESVNL